MRILVIEDETPLLEEILSLLAFEGYEAVGAENGRIGLEKARQLQPDLIISDIMMPELDGYGVLVELYEDPDIATIPFIFLTAKSERRDIRKGMEFGASDYLSKPFTNSEIIGAVRAQLEKRALLEEKYERQLQGMEQVIVNTLPHEFRTPLTSIIAYSDMLATDYESLDPHTARKMIESISRAGSRLWHLIENYLLYTQIELVMRTPRKFKAVREMLTGHPEEVIMAFASIKADMLERSDDLMFDLEPVGAIYIGEDNLQKIVEELIDNACKFSEAGSPIEIKSVVEGEHYILTILDHGHGMSEEQIARIGAYAQFERSIYEQQGVGLGLIIVRGLAEMHDGELSITSSPGMKTAARVKLRIG
jgi:signal transduction histidine kinase